MDKPDALIVGDIHYRDSQPKCRLDDFWETQKRKALWLRELWEECGRPLVLQPGDVFHHWKSSPQVIRAVLEYLPPMVCVAGNHDLPSHSLELYDKSALAVVERADSEWVVLSGPPERWVIAINNPIWGFPWGVLPVNFIPKRLDNHAVMLSHITMLDGPAMFDGEQASEFLEQMTGYGLIVTGDNHKQIWITSKDGRQLVNPGCFTRQSVTEADYQPHVFLWYAEGNLLKPVPVPIQPASEVITREHISTKEQRDERITAFVESLAGEVELGINYRENVLRCLGKVRQAVQERVMEAIDG